MVLNNLNFEIEKGSITTILGFSGAGKSTFMKHLLGLVKPTSGSLEILGENIAALDAYQMREFRKNFGMVFQYAALFDSFSAIDNISFPMKEFTNWSKEEIGRRALKLLNSVGLEEGGKGQVAQPAFRGHEKEGGFGEGIGPRA